MADADYIIIERSASITASAEQISPLIVNFHEWTKWSPWEGIDPDLERTYSGPESGVGAHYEWSGNKKAGAGSMEIKRITPVAIELDLDFTRPYKSASKTVFDLTPEGDDTLVLWQVKTPKSLLLKIMSPVLKLDKTVGKDLEKGLAQLKTAAEAS